MKETRVFIPCGEIRLEGLLSRPDGNCSAGGLVLCHPHPLYGGDMHNTVIEAGVKAAQECGLVTLRFNFRGVGGSGGSYSDGLGEREDVKAAVDYLYSGLEGPCPKLGLMGYSFGAWVSLPVAVADDRIEGFVAVAPPLTMHDFDLLTICRKMLLLVAGSKDAFCPLSDLKKLYERLEGPKYLRIIDGADHFFFSCEHLLIAPLRDFFAKLLKPSE